MIFLATTITSQNLQYAIVGAGLVLLGIIGGIFGRGPNDSS
jgi:hypothetical protein